MEKKLISQLSENFEKCFEKKGKILIAGNGGSAAIANHIAGEFVATFLKKKRKAYSVISLCENVSIITAIANDFKFNYIFQRQIEALGSKEDILLVMSTSGKSQNIKNAINFANKNNILTIGMFGKKKTLITKKCKISLHSKYNDTARVQEDHLYTLHETCRNFE